MNTLRATFFAGVFVPLLLLQLPAAEAATETVVYSFCSQNNCADGGDPESGLIDVNGTLYGTTAASGASNGGTVFALDPSTGTETVIYSFCSQASCSDGKTPSASLIEEGGTLYGTTTAGGSGGYGTVFSIDPKTGTETVLHSFGTGDGNNPYANVIDLKGSLYGTTLNGGAYGYGTVFSLDIATGAEKVLHSFGGGNGMDGYLPYAGLVDLNHTLYGTTEGLGHHDYGQGNVFSIDPKSGALTVVYTFQGRPDGKEPTAPVIDVDGTLYGTSILGGAHYRGTVFSVNPATGAETILYSFCSKHGEGKSCVDGQWPSAGLVEVNGLLYGATSAGGHNATVCNGGCGTVFSVDPKTGAETTAYRFCSQQPCVDGELPGSGSLINVNGILYGTTSHGGAKHNAGVVFAIHPK